MPTFPRKRLPTVIIPEPRGPLWAGPSAPGPLGGVTFSMLSSWLSCKERFRVKYVLGLRAADQFNHRMEYGSGWHVCEEAHAAGKDWETPLAVFYAKLYEKYPTQRQEVEKWYNVTRAQFPHYVNHWKNHPDVVARTPLFQEQVFDVPYKLPSGRTVRLRGKVDGAGIVTENGRRFVDLDEHKTKGDIDEREIRRQLTWDLQTMLYTVVLHWMNEHDEGGKGLPASKSRFGAPVRGVRYNVVRRPLSGGRHTIKKHEPTAKNPAGESDESFYTRLSDRIRDDADYFFMRWTVEVTAADVQRFRRECLDPILEQVCDWYSWVSVAKDPFSPDDGTENSVDRPVSSYTHFRHPFGAGGAVAEYGWQDVDGYLAGEGEVGLRRRDTLFEELQ